MKTAFMLFMQKSFKAVTLREIIARSGFSNGAFYHYFKTKEELFIEVANHYWFEFINLPFPAQEGITLKDFIQGSLERSEKVMDIIDKEFNIDSEGANFYSFIFEAYRIIPTFKERTLLAQNKELTIWMEVIASAKRSGEIKSDLDNEILAQYFVTISYGNAITRLINQDVGYMRKTMRLLWEGLYTMLKA
ncbi:MAG: TetR/AcrR family transcriptional regulator; helix-turn-helix transcriptional regulator [Bacteroidales bacterium]|nr:TetR/AcrR family transcriptional regulator; helix-turn-helix transcriptional regulator [Bacteroidales bacterium]